MDKDNPSDPKLSFDPIESVESDYEPYNFRSKEHGQTTFQAFCNLLKSMIGTGVLALPLAFNQAGYILASVILILIAFCTAFCLGLLVKTNYIICKREKVPYLPYSETLRHSFLYGPEWLKWLSPIARYAVRAIISIFQLGILIVYILFCSENLQIVVQQEFKKDYPLKVYLIALVIPLMMIMSIRRLNNIAFFSLFANIVINVGLFIMTVYMCTDFKPHESVKAVQSYETWPLFFGTACFAFAASGVVIPISSKMKRPEYFFKNGGIWYTAMTITISIYVVFGIIGYLKYGNTAKDVVILNMPPDLLSMWVKVIFSLAIFFSYPIQAFPAVDIIFTDVLGPFLDPSSKHWFLEYLVRYFIVIFSFFMALLVPKISLIISLTGSLTVPLITFIFPVWIDYLIHWPHNGLWRKTRTLLITIFGLAGLVVGTGTTVYDIVNPN